MKNLENRLFRCLLRRWLRREGETFVSTIACRLPDEKVNDICFGVAVKAVRPKKSEVLAVMFVTGNHCLTTLKRYAGIVEPEVTQGAED